MPKTITRRLLSCALLAASVDARACPSAAASAQDSFPTRPVRLLVPYAAGGGTDAIARLVAQGVGEKLGQSLIVENNGAAGGNVATQQAASAAPDGYTVLMANQGPMVVNPHLFKNMKVDPLTAFDPVTLITAAPLVVVVPKNSPHKDLELGRVRPEEPRQAHLRFGRQRLGEPPRHRAARPDDEAGGGARAVSRRRSGPDRPHRRPHGLHDHHHAVRSRADRGGRRCGRSA